MENIRFENCRICFKNFGAKPTDFNPAGGKRDFCVLIDTPEQAEYLSNLGINVKWLKPKEEGDNPQPYVKVNVNYGQVQPDINIVTGKKITKLNAETVGQLDYAAILNVDLVVNPYHWTQPHREGISLYAVQMYVTIEEDYFKMKYEQYEEDSAPLPFG